LDVSLKDAGEDSNKKAVVVNQVAETISKINKIEDFTKQQDYIKRCAAILRIEESGLNALVNKFIREKVSKQENRRPAEEEQFFQEQAIQQGVEEDTLNLLNKDELQERALVRCLIEFGMRAWDENKRVADHIFEESVEQPMVDNKDLVRIIEIYKVWYDSGIEPGPKNFLYHEDQQLSALALAVMDFPYELSPNWSEHYDGKILTREDLFREEVSSTLNYLKLRKIKRMILENQKDLEGEMRPEQYTMLIQTHQHLKELEQVLLKVAGTVIVK